MFRMPSATSLVERFIGGLTIALGLGAMIPRKGYGLYALLEAEGDRGIWALSMLAVGTWLIIGSYMHHMPIMRITILTAGVVFWIAILDKFITANLWGAAIQACVIIVFGIDAGIRLFYAQVHDDTQPKRGA